MLDFDLVIITGNRFLDIQLRFSYIQLTLKRVLIINRNGSIKVDFFREEGERCSHSIGKGVFIQAGFYF